MAAAMARAMPVLYLPALFRLEDHVQCRAIFYRAGRIIALQLDQNGIAGLAGHALQTHKGRITHGLFNGFKIHGAYCT
jgi:hypothetical protein